MSYAARRKSSCLSLPELANNGSGIGAFHLRGATQSSIWCHERGTSRAPHLHEGERPAFRQDGHATSLWVVRAVWLNASLADIPTGGRFVTNAARGMAPGHALAAPRLQGYGEEKAGTRSARNTDLFEETVMNRSAGRNGGVRVFHSTARTNYKVGLIWIPFLADKSNLEQVIDLTSCFLMTLLCICGVGCVVKKFRPQIL